MYYIMDLDWLCSKLIFTVFSILGFQRKNGAIGGVCSRWMAGREPRLGVYGGWADNAGHQVQPGAFWYEWPVRRCPLPVDLEGCVPY